MLCAHKLLLIQTRRVACPQMPVWLCVCLPPQSATRRKDLYEFSGFAFEGADKVGTGAAHVHMLAVLAAWVPRALIKERRLAALLTTGSCLGPKAAHREHLSPVQPIMTPQQSSISRPEQLNVNSCKAGSLRAAAAK